MSVVRGQKVAPLSATKKGRPTQVSCPLLDIQEIECSYAKHSQIGCKRERPKDLPLNAAKLLKNDRITGIHRLPKCLFKSNSWAVIVGATRYPNQERWVNCHVLAEYQKDLSLTYDTMKHLMKIIEQWSLPNLSWLVWLDILLYNRNWKIQVWWYAHTTKYINLHR